MASGQPSVQKRRIAWLPRMSFARMAGIGLVALSLGLTVLIAFMGTAKKPASRSQTVLLAVVAGFLQIGGAVAFSREGRADPSHARSAVRQLYANASFVVAARELAERYEARKAGPEELRAAMGKLSVVLSVAEEGFVQAVDDWREVHPIVLEDITPKGAGRP